jgi:hypothetical protein
MAKLFLSPSFLSWKNLVKYEIVLQSRRVMVVKYISEHSGIGDPDPVWDLWRRGREKKGRTVGRL